MSVTLVTVSKLMRYDVACMVTDNALDHGISKVILCVYIYTMPPILVLVIYDYMTYSYCPTVQILHVPIYVYTYMLIWCVRCMYDVGPMA